MCRCLGFLLEMGVYMLTKILDMSIYEIQTGNKQWALLKISLKFMADKILLFCTFHHNSGGFPKYKNIINVYNFQINEKTDQVL